MKAFLLNHGADKNVVNSGYVKLYYCCACFSVCVQNDVLVVDNFIFIVWKENQYHRGHAKWVFA